MHLVPQQIARVIAHSRTARLAFCMSVILGMICAAIAALVANIGIDSPGPRWSYNAMNRLVRTDVLWMFVSCSVILVLVGLAGLHAHITHPREYCKTFSTNCLFIFYVLMIPPMTRGCISGIVATRLHALPESELPAMRKALDQSRAIGLYVSTGLTIAALVAFAIAKRAQKLYLYPFCEQCGYDLTGNESGACSECGTRLQSNLRNVDGACE